MTDIPASPPAKVVGKAKPFHPPLFAAYTVLSLYAANTALIPPEEVYVPLAIVLAASLVIWGGLWAILRDLGRAAAGTSIIAIGFFSFGPTLDVIQHTGWGRGWNSADLFPWWAFLWAALLVAGVWKWKRFNTPTRGLNIAAMALVLFPLFSIVTAWLQGGKTVVAAKGSSKAGSFTGTRPDIFYVILDGYGRSDALKRDMAFDNSEFVDGLRKRGFYVAPDARSNYCQTELSLTSSLNMDFLPSVVPNFASDGKDRTVLDALMDRSRLSRTLRDYGYAYIGITSGFPGVHPLSADLVLKGPGGSSLFESALLARTPFTNTAIGASSAFDRRREDLTAAIQNLGGLGAPSSRPRFVFTHVLAPHPPFVFGPNGEPIRPHHMYAIVDGSHFMQNGGTPEEYREGYTGQAQTIGRMMLKAVDEILAKEKTPPIIVIQGDHGPKMRLDQELLEKTDISEVFPILNAYYVPPKVRAALYPGITPVNSFRTILREQFGEPLPNLPDRSWYSGWSWPFRLFEVTSKVP